MRRLIDIAEIEKFSSQGSYISHLQHCIRKQLLLDIKIVIVNVRRSEVARHGERIRATSSPGRDRSRIKYRHSRLNNRIANQGIGHVGNERKSRIQIVSYENRIRADGVVRRT